MKESRIDSLSNVFDIFHTPTHSSIVFARYNTCLSLIEDAIPSYHFSQHLYQNLLYNSIIVRFLNREAALDRKATGSGSIALVDPDFLVHLSCDEGERE